MKRILPFLAVISTGYMLMAQGSALVLDSTHTFEYSNETDSTHLWKHAFSYDELENLIMELSYSWDTFLEEWTGNYWKNFHYDATGYKILEELHDWNWTSGEWNNHSKKEWAYEPKGLPLMEAHYYWEVPAY
jgi:hypothetical protein